MSVREQDGHARAVSSAKCAHIWDRHLRLGPSVEGQADVENERVALVLDLDAATPDLVSAAMDARSHCQAAMPKRSVVTAMTASAGVKRSHSHVSASRTHQAVRAPVLSPST